MTINMTKEFELLKSATKLLESATIIYNELVQSLMKHVQESARLGKQCIDSQTIIAECDITFNRLNNLVKEYELREK